MEKLCTSLKVKFLFDLFEKVALCLTMVASLNYNVMPSKITTEEGPKKSKAFEEVDGLSTDLKNSVVTSKKICNKVERTTHTSSVKSGFRLKNKLRGVNLYN